VSAGGVIRTVAGGGGRGACGDGARATAACLGTPRGIAAEKVRGGGFLIPDTDNRRIRRVRDGVIRTVAGPRGFRAPFAVSALPDGGFLVADPSAHRIRRVSASGRVTTVAGTGRAGFSGDGGSARRARLDGPHGVYVLADGGFLVADTFNHRIRRVSPGGRITTVAGTSRRGYAGDGGDATRARLNQPKGVAVGPDGGLLIADANNDAVRYVAPGRPARLAVAVRGRIVRAARGRAVDVPIVSTLEATVRVTVLSSAGRPVRSEVAQVGAGVTGVSLPAGLGEGRRRIVVRARGGGGRASSDRSVLLVGG
jgi:hypothetical protein